MSNNFSYVIGQWLPNYLPYVNKCLANLLFPNKFNFNSVTKRTHFNVYTQAGVVVATIPCNTKIKDILQHPDIIDKYHIINSEKNIICDGSVVITDDIYCVRQFDDRILNLYELKYKPVMIKNSLYMIVGRFAIYKINLITECRTFIAMLPQINYDINGRIFDVSFSHDGVCAYIVTSKSLLICFNIIKKQILYTKPFKKDPRSWLYDNIISGNSEDYYDVNLSENDNKFSKFYHKRIRCDCRYDREKFEIYTLDPNTMMRTGYVKFNSIVDYDLKFMKHFIILNYLVTYDCRCGICYIKKITKC